MKKVARTMGWCASVIVVLVAFVCSNACGSSPAAPSETPQTRPGTDLVVTDVSVKASLENLSISYLFCYSIAPASQDLANMTYRRVDYTTIGPSGDVYNTSPDSRLIGQTIGPGRGGCVFNYWDQNIDRPVATRYRLSFEYVSGNDAQLKTQTVSGNISSTVPPQPFITGVTLTHDIKDPQKILRQPTPVTFTVTNVDGGTPPFLYEWRLNGFLLRDWDPNPVLIWDGATLGGRPVVSGGYTLGVRVRRSTWPQVESAALVSFNLLLF